MVSEQESSLIEIYKKEFIDAIRNKWLIIFSAVYFLLVIGIPYFLLIFIRIFGVENLPKEITTLALQLTPVVPLLPFFLGALSISGERETGTLEFLLSQPIGKAEVFISKFLGLLTASSVVIIIGLGVAGMTAYAFGPSSLVLGPYLTVMAVTVGLSISALSIGMFLSILSRDRATASGLALFVWFFLTIIYNLGFIGIIFLAVGISPSILIALAVLNPVQVAGTLTVLFVEPSLIALGPVGGTLVREFGISLTALFLSVALLVWILVPFFVSLLVFSREDL